MFRKSSRHSGYYHRTILNLALPAMLAQLSLPLLGLVDTAVMGHFASTEALAAIATGTALYMMVASSTGFLRSSTLGLVAQAWGRGDNAALRDWFLRSFLLALGVGVLLTGLALLLLIFFDWQSFDPGFYQSLYDYLIIRIWALPACTVNLVCLGMVLGFQDARSVLRIMLLANIVNILLDLVFVIGVGMQADGVALATLLAEYFAALYGLKIVLSRLRGRGIILNTKDIARLIQNLPAFRALCVLNGHFFVRSTILSLCFAALPVTAARFGAEFTAANAVVLNLWFMMSYSMDGIANAAESLTGRAIGRGLPRLLRGFVWRLHLWVIPVAIFYIIVFIVFFDSFIAFQTSDVQVRTLAMEMRIWLYLALLISPFCLLLDGIYYGATLGKEVSSSMLVAGCIFGFSLLVLPEYFGNAALWFSLNILFFARTVGLYLFLPKVMHKAQQERQSC